MSVQNHFNEKNKFAIRKMNMRRFTDESEIKK